MLIAKAYHNERQGQMFAAVFGISPNATDAKSHELVQSVVFDHLRDLESLCKQKDSSVNQVAHMTGRLNTPPTSAEELLQMMNYASNTLLYSGFAKARLTKANQLAERFGY
jgi:hypothetical protein